MAKIPSYKRIYENDYPQDSRGLIAKLASSLNYIIEIITISLNGRLTFSDNMQNTITDIDIELDSNGEPKTRTLIKLTSEYTPSGCIILKVENLTDSTYPTTAPFITWEKFGSNIEIKHITGLSASKRYRIKLLALV